MSRGCPVITTNVGGFPEITRSDFIIATNDYTELASRIKALIENTQLYQEISHYNYYKAKEYSGDKLDGIRNKFFQEVITG
ncbi:Glycosyl transferases group 1 [compost metagenome]